MKNNLKKIKFFKLEAEGFEPEILDYIENDQTVLEKYPLETLSKNQQLGAFKHTGFWRPIDTLRDKMFLDDLWKSKNPPWKIW